MQLSTAGRYALRAMVDLARHREEGPIQCAEIAARQEVSDQYLSQLFLKLKRAGLVESVRGPGGGYVLADDPTEITASDVLQAVEEKLDPVFCVKEDEEPACHRVDGCPTHALWARLSGAIHRVLDSVTLADLAQGSPDPLSGAGELDQSFQVQEPSADASDELPSGGAQALSPLCDLDHIFLGMIDSMPSSKEEGPYGTYTD
jgi:Rrf2 family protein